MGQARKFGWFAGVFTPSILTILGVIMYLRLPSIVGQAGAMTTIGIIVVAHVISVCTGLSVASIATDKKVQAGGTYYMISRSLGLPIGGTLGLALFVGLSFSVSLYVIGFSESFLGYWGLSAGKDAIRLTGSITLLVVTVVTFLSTELALKTQFYIMAAIGLSLLSILTGSHEFTPAATVASASVPVQAAPFIVLFGIFFPAVTGFEAGVSMSGDLRDPKKAIPVGTILAILVGLVVYIALAIFLAQTVSAEALRDDPGVLLEISRIPALVVAGIWGATISSALGSILGAPRILQATAVDRISPRFFAKGFGPSNEPRNALLVTFLIAEAGILIGELDVIARIVSMFFITTYGFLNLSCAIERWASPDFRPDFKVPAWVSLVGSAACFVVMIQLDFLAMVGASVVLGGLYLTLARRQLTLASGDTWEGVWSSVARIALSRLDERRAHQRNWRPNILLFAGSADGRGHLRRLGDWLAYRRGIVSNVDLVEKPSAAHVARPERVARLDPRTGFFGHRVECEDIYTGMTDVARFHGFAGVDPNTVLVGWPRHGRTPERFHAAMDAIAEMDLNILILDHDPERDYGSYRTIDVWMTGGGKNASLALALVRFLTSADPWRRATVRVLKWHEGESAFARAAGDALRDILGAQRLMAAVQVVQATPGESFAQAVRRESGESDLTLIGLPGAGRLASEAFVDQTNEIIAGIGTVLMLRASSSFDDLHLGDFADEARMLPVNREDGDDSVDVAVPVVENEALRPELSRLEAKLREVTKELREQLMVAESLGGGLVSETVGLARGSLETLGRGLRSADRPRWTRTVDREAARVLFRNREILSEAAGDTVESQARTLSAALGLAARTLAGVPSSLPPRTGGGEGRRSRGVRLRTRFEEDLLPSLLDHLAEVARRFDRRSAARVNVAARLQAGLVDSLQRIAVAGEREVDPGVVDAERERLAGLEAELLDELDSARGADMAEVSRRALAIMKAWVPTAVREGGSRVRRKRSSGRATEADLSRLRNVGTVWSERQLLRLSETELQTRLSGARHRMGVVLDRTLRDVGAEVDRTVGRLEALEQSLSDLAGNSGLEALERAADVRANLDGRAIVTGLADDLRHGLEDLPEVWRVGHGVGEAPDDVFESPPVRIVEPRAVVDRRLKATLVTQLEPGVLRLSESIRAGVDTAHDVVRLIRFASAEDESLVGEGSLRSVVTRGADRLALARKSIIEAWAGVESSATAGLRSVESHLMVSALSADPRGAATIGSPRPSLPGTDALVRLRRSVVRTVVGLLYRRSKGVILSERLRAGEGAGQTQLDRLLGLVEGLSPRPDVLSRMPFYYRQLFLGHVAATRDFWVSRPRVEAPAELAWARYERGHEGGLLIVGDPGSGRSSLASHLVQTKSAVEAIRVVPPLEASAEVSRFQEHLARALGASADPEDVLGRLPAGTPLVVEDLDLWWERRSGGLAVVEHLLGLIDRFGGRCFVIMTATPATGGLLRRMVPLEDRLLASAHLDPFSAEALRDIVIMRHRSTGLGLTMDGRPMQGLADWRAARFFNQLFDRTHGNPGEALQSWVASIRSFRADEVQVESLVLPRLTPLRELHARRRAVLAAVMVHRRLANDGLHRIMGLGSDELQEEVGALVRAGLLERENQGLHINRYVEPFLRRELGTRGIV